MKLKDKLILIGVSIICAAALAVQVLAWRYPVRLVDLSSVTMTSKERP
jgi:hypothetical protein